MAGATRAALSQRPRRGTAWQRAHCGAGRRPGRACQRGGAGPGGGRRGQRRVHTGPFRLNGSCRPRRPCPCCLLRKNQRFGRPPAERINCAGLEVFVLKLNEMSAYADIEGEGSTSRHSKAASDAMCAVREMDWIFGVDPIRICICRSNHYLHTFEASSPIFGDLFTELTKILICDHSTKITRTEN